MRRSSCFIKDDYVHVCQFFPGSGRLDENSVSRGASEGAQDNYQGAGGENANPADNDGGESRPYVVSCEKREEANAERETDKKAEQPICSPLGRSGKLKRLLYGNRG